MDNKTGLLKNDRINLNLNSNAKLLGLLFVLPVVVGTLIFDIAPLFISTWLSFVNWHGFGETNFVGLTNFQKLISNPQFANSLKVTFYYMIGVVPLTLAFGLFLAVLLYHRGFRLPGAGWFRVLFFLPYVTSPVAIGVVWRWIYNNDFGLINSILWRLGLPGVDWLGNVSTVMPAVILVGIWYGAGYNMVLFMSGLSSIPQELYEAATVDGASNWRQFFSITLPLITPIILFILILSVIGSFQIFGLVYTMTEGGPGYASSVIIYYLYQQAFMFRDFGYASAIVLVLFCILGFITWVQWKASEKWVFYQ